MDEQKLRQLFKNRSNCYADADDVVQAMDENCFVETVKEVLHLHEVSKKSEQLKCEKCGAKFVPHLMKPLTICDKCADSFAL